MATATRFDPFTTADAAQLGLSRRDLVAAVREGSLRRILRGVYVDARASDTRELRIRAIDLIKPRHAVACNETAAWLHGIDAFKPSERFVLEPFFVVPHSTSRINRANVRCRQAYIEAADLMQVHDIVVTTPVRTVSDLLRRLYRPYALAAADAFAGSGLVTPFEIVQFVQRLKGYPGIVQARSLSRIIDPRAQSPGESWQRLRILDAGFPPPVPQFEVIDSLGRTWYLDHAYPDLLIGSEYDGVEFHTAREHREHDSDRRGFLTEVHGWRWVNADRSRLFGNDSSFEEDLGELLGMPPLLPRRWGGR